MLLLKPPVQLGRLSKMETSICCHILAVVTLSKTSLHRRASGCRWFDQHGARLSSLVAYFFGASLSRPAGL